MLNIPDQFYTDASAAIAPVWQNTYPGATEMDVERILRSYVYLGVNKKIQDFDSGLSSDERGAIVTAVANRTQDYYSVRYDVSQVQQVLDIMQTDEMEGLVAPNIAEPFKYETQYETDIAAGKINTPNPVTKVIGDLFSGVGDAANAALKGLGFDIPLSTILYGAIFLVIIIVIIRYGRKS